MYYARFLKILPLLGLTLLFATKGFADEPLEIAKETLSGYETSLKNTASRIHTTEGRIKSYETKIEDARKKLATAEEELVVARRELIQAQHDKTEDAERKLALAQKSYDLSERGKQNREKRLTRLIGKHEDLQKDREKLIGDSNNLQVKIKEQAERVLQLTTKASQASKKATVVAEAKPKVTATPPPPPPPAVKIEKAPEEVSGPENKEEPAPSAQLAKLTPEEKPTPKVTPEKKEAAKTDSPQKRYAERQMELLSEKIRSGTEDDEWNRYKDLEITVENEDPNEFEFLGSYQYYAEISLEAGKQLIKIGNQRYRIHINDAGTYVVIYDTTDAGDPKFSIFNQNLLD